LAKWPSCLASRTGRFGLWRDDTSAAEEVDAV